MDCDHCGYERGTVDCCGRGDVEQLTRERDEARAERDEAEVEVERLRAVALLAADFVRQGTKAMSEVERLMRERDDARAEVEQLRGLIALVRRGAGERSAQAWLLQLLDRYTDV